MPFLMMFDLCKYHGACPRLQAQNPGRFIGVIQAKPAGAKAARKPRRAALSLWCRTACSDRLLEKCHTSITRDSLCCSRASRDVGLHQLKKMPGNAAKLLSLPSSRSIYTQSWTSEYPWGRRDLSIIVDAMT